MYVIQMFDEYWLRDRDEVIEEICDLEAATHFETKEDALTALKSTTFAEYCEIQKLTDVLPGFLEWKAHGMVRRVIPKISSKSRPYENEGLEEVIEFHKYHMDHEDEIRYEDYLTWPSVDAFLECFWDLEHYTTEDYQKSLITFRIMIDRSAKFETFKKELDILLPHITFVNENGFLVMSIFDHELSRYESRYLFYNKSDDEHQIKNHLGHVLYSGTLEQCFDRIQERYYYD